MNSKAMNVLVLSVWVLVAIPFAQAAEKSDFSGFLGDYSQLKPDQAGISQLWYENPNKPLKTYKKFIVDPVLVHFRPNANGTSINPSKLNELTTYLRSKVVAVISQRFEAVSQPGPGVARLRAAITSIEQTEPVFNIHPLMKLSGMGLGGAAVEVEVVDSVTGERLAAVMDERLGDRFGFKAGLESLGHAYQVIDMWADNVERRINKIYGPK